MIHISILLRIYLQGKATEMLRKAFSLEPGNKVYSSHLIHNLRCLADWPSLEKLHARLELQHDLITQEEYDDTIEAFDSILNDGDDFEEELLLYHQHDHLFEVLGIHPFTCLFANCSAALQLRRAVSTSILQGQSPLVDDGNLLSENHIMASLPSEDEPLVIGFLSSNFINHAQGAQLRYYFDHYEEDTDDEVVNTWPCFHFDRIIVFMIFCFFYFFLLFSSCFFFPSRVLALNMQSFALIKFKMFPSHFAHLLCRSIYIPYVEPGVPKQKRHRYDERPPHSLSDISHFLQNFCVAFINPCSGYCFQSINAGTIYSGDA